MKKYTDDEILELEDQAELKQRRDAAMRILEPEKPDPVAVMREREAQRREAQHKANMDARARRLEGMVATEAGRYNPQQQAAALKWLEENGYGKEGERRRQFDEGQKTLRIESENKMRGMVGQGSEAAKHNAEATISAAKITADANKEIEAGKRAAEKWLGETASKDRRYGIDAEHGTIGNDGKVTPGSRERITRIQGESEVQKQKAANEGLVAQAEIARQNKERELSTQIEKSIIAANGKASAANIAAHTKIITAAIQGGTTNGKDFPTIFAELEEQYKNDPEMIKSIKASAAGQQQQTRTDGKPEKGTEKTFPNGDVGVWDGTKWVKKD